MIYEHLKEGKEQATSFEKLMKITRLSQRDLYRAIAEERKAGYLICGSRRPPGGYYIASNRQEAAETLEAMEKQAKSMFLACKTFRKATEIIDGQADIEDFIK